MQVCAYADEVAIMFRDKEVLVETATMLESEVQKKKI